MNLANQVYPKISIGLNNACLDAIQRPHGYIIFDTTDGLSFGTDLFPTD